MILIPLGHQKTIWGMSMHECYIFDLDGTLIDANQLHRKSFSWAVAQVSDFNITTELEDLLEGIPTLNKIDYINSKFDQGIDPGSVYELKQVYTDANLNTVHMDTMLIDQLRELSKRKRVALASNARSKFVFSVLNQFNLDMFEVVLTANYLPIDKRKPDPYIFNETIRLLGADKSTTCIFEDSDVGYEAATKSFVDRVYRVSSSKETLEILNEVL
jgi:beta-phosphoglucomutase